MKFLAEVLTPELRVQTIRTENRQAQPRSSHPVANPPDYRKMRIEIQKNANPVSFESLKAFYHMK